MAAPAESSPYELKRNTTPRVRAEAGHVVVRLELVALRDPLDTLDLEIVLTGGYAQQLGFSLFEAAKNLER
jgi:hypothetical protein